jgi:hypothetical protein
MGWVIHHGDGIIERGEVDDDGNETVTYEIPPDES